MKKLVVMMLCISIVACAGSGRKNDKSDNKNEVTTSQTIGGEAAPNSEENIEEKAIADICKMAEDYQEMAISALENGDAKTFKSTMERREEWLNSLNEEDRKWADASIALWDTNNAERKDKVLDKALTMPRMMPDEVEATRR